jgi:hypothetical protein
MCAVVRMCTMLLRNVCCGLHVHHATSECVLWSACAPCCFGMCAVVCMCTMLLRNVCCGLHVHHATSECVLWSACAPCYFGMCAVVRMCTLLLRNVCCGPHVHHATSECVLWSACAPCYFGMQCKYKVVMHISASESLCLFRSAWRLGGGYVPGLNDGRRHGLRLRGRERERGEVASRLVPLIWCKSLL